MAVSTYTELKTAVAEWLHRDGMSSRAPDFIQQGEAWLNRKLRTMDMEERYAFNMGVVNRFQSLPTGYLELQSLYYTNPHEEITFVEPSRMTALINGSGKPEWFTIKDGIEFDCIPSDTYACEMHYFKAMDIAGDTTNWLLTNHPDVYLYASLAAASVYVVDDARIPTIKALLNEYVQDLNDLSARKRGSQMVELRTEFIPSGFNFITG